MLGGRPVVHVTYDGRMSDFGERMGLAPQARSGARLVVRRGVPRLERDRDAFQGIESFVEPYPCPGAAVAPDVVTVGDDIPSRMDNASALPREMRPIRLPWNCYLPAKSEHGPKPSFENYVCQVPGSLDRDDRARVRWEPFERPATASSRVFIGDVPDTDVRVGIIATDRHARSFSAGALRRTRR